MAWGSRPGRWALRKRFALVTAILAMAMTALPASPARAGELRPAQLRAQIKTVRAHLNRISARLSHAEGRLELAASALARHRRAITRAEADRRRIQGVLSHQASELYKLGGPGAELEVLFSTEDPSLVFQRLDFLEQVRSGERGLLEELRTLRRRSREDSRRLQAALSVSRAAYRELRSQRAQLARRLSEYGMLLRFLDLVGGRTVLRPSRFGPRGFVCPVAGPSGLYNDYGAPRRGGPHTGVDLPASYGQRVVAVLPGRVVDTPSGGWIGRGIIMRDLIGNEWWYAHLSARSVRAGERVVPGEVLGRVGCSGHCFGPHLHFEYHPGGGGPRNPYPILAAAC